MIVSLASEKNNNWNVAHCAIKGLISLLLQVIQMDNSSCPPKAVILTAYLQTQVQIATSDILTSLEWGPRIPAFQQLPK